MTPTTSDMAPQPSPVDAGCLTDSGPAETKTAGSEAAGPGGRGEPGEPGVVVSLVEIAAAVPVEVLAPGSGRRLWERVYRARIRAGWEVCRHGGAPARPGVLLTLDHLCPVSQGGATSLANSTILCRACIQAKGVNRWPHLPSLAAEEDAALPQRQWARLAGIWQLRAARNAWCVAGIDGCAVTLTRSARRGASGGGRVMIGHVPADVLAHIGAHRAAGHHVPHWADDLITAVTAPVTGVVTGASGGSDAEGGAGHAA